MTFLHNFVDIVASFFLSFKLEIVVFMLLKLRSGEARRHFILLYITVSCGI